MRDSRDLPDLIGQAHAAAVDPALWAGFIRSLAAALKATAGQVIYWTGRTGVSSLTTSVGIDPSRRADYDRYYGTLDVWGRTGTTKNLFCEGVVLPSQAVVPYADLIRTEFFSDWALPAGFVHGVSGVVLVRDSVAANLALVRAKGHSPFDMTAVRVLRALVPHVRRAMLTHERIERLDRQLRALAGAVDRLGDGVVFLDAHGRVLSMNRAAHAIMDARDGLQLDRRHIRATDPGEHRRFRAFLDDALCPPAVSSLDGAVLMIERPSGLRPFGVALATIAHSPDKADALANQPGAAAVMFISNPEAQSVALDHFLRKTYRLTDTEVRATFALLQGSTVPEIATHLRVKVTTVRTHLQHVFQKTGTRSQSDLIRLLQASIPRLA